VSDINHFAISSILGSEIAGRFNAGHGQIDSLGDAQRFVEAKRLAQTTGRHRVRERVDKDKVAEVFLQLREARGDLSPPDLYIADPLRNEEFIARCRKAGIEGSVYAINKTLMNLRRHSRLKGLHSVRTSFDYEDYAFASEFAATELKYLTGASIDDIICDPGLASRFDSIAQALAPGFTPLRYRWAILSVRKAGRQTKWRPEWQMPAFDRQFRLVQDPLQAMPNEQGVYILYESGRQLPLYARATERLRHAVEVHRSEQLLKAIDTKLWRPDPASFVLAYSTLPSRLLRPVEKRVVEEWKPVFNVPRTAA
jgi:site-specific DNA-methyltransferase (adenine-specific)